VCRPFTIDFLVIIIIISLSAYSIIMPSLITPLLGLFVIFTIIKGGRKKRVGGGGGAVGVNILGFKEDYKG
jgi:hypothetical protein